MQVLFPPQFPDVNFAYSHTFPLFLRLPSLPPAPPPPLPLSARVLVPPPSRRSAWVRLRAVKNRPAASGREGAAASAAAAAAAAVLGVVPVLAFVPTSEREARETRPDEADAETAGTQSLLRVLPWMTAKGHLEREFQDTRSQSVSRPSSCCF